MEKFLVKLSIFKNQKSFSTPILLSISSHLGFSKTIGSTKYLKLPSVGKWRKIVFDLIKDRIWNHINHLTSKQLSKASKEILVKCVAQSIPTYCMIVYLLPFTLATRWITEDDDFFLVRLSQPTKKRN